jgi:hypothetical protein
MNKNSRRARKLGLTSYPETTNGTGSGRQIVSRQADPIFKGEKCDTRWDNPNSNRRSRRVYGKKQGNQGE